MSTEAEPPVAEMHAVYAGAIDTSALERIFKGCTAAINANVPRLHLLMQSAGGFVGDGVCLYNFFRAMPIPLTLYNAGGLQSIATLAFLGAKQRKANASASFMVHRTHMSPEGANADSLRASANLAILDDERTENILRQHLTFPDELWLRHRYEDIFISAQDAVRYGLATAVGDFAPPLGGKVHAF
jgi:ATP-dependent Clp protease protease subunit